jgi:hypothetical protein
MMTNEKEDVMQQTRRALIGNLATLFVAAPAVIRIPGLLMPIKPQQIAQKYPYWPTDPEIFWDVWDEFRPGSSENYRKYVSPPLAA